MPARTRRRRKQTRPTTCIWYSIQEGLLFNYGNGVASSSFFRCHVVVVSLSSSLAASSPYYLADNNTLSVNKRINLKPTSSWGKTRVYQNGRERPLTSQTTDWQETWLLTKALPESRLHCTSSTSSSMITEIILNTTLVEWGPTEPLSGGGGVFTNMK